MNPRDLNEYQPIPAGEATELPHPYGRLLWDQAVEQLQATQPRELELEAMA